MQQILLQLRPGFGPFFNKNNIGIYLTLTVVMYPCKRYLDLDLQITYRSTADMQPVL